MTSATPSISVTIHPKGAAPVERELQGTEISLGRARTCDLWIDDRYVSSHHAKLVWDGRQYLFADSGSSNGSWVNGVKVIEVPLKRGDVISLGETRVAIDSFQIRAIAGDASAPSGILAPESDRPGSTLSPRPDPRKHFLFEGLLREMDGDLNALREQYDYLIDRLGRMTDEDEHRLLERSGRKARESLSAIHEAISTLQQDHRRLHTLHAATAMINRVTDLKGRLNAILDLAIEIMKADCGFLLLYDEKRDRISVALQRGMEVIDEHTGQVDILVERSTMPSFSIAREVLRSRTVYASDDLQNDSQFDAAQSVMLQNIVGVLCAPLIFDDELIGLIYVDFRDLPDSEPRRIGKGDRELFQALASLAATTIQNAKFFRNIRREVERRTNLQRYLAPELAEQVIRQDRAVNLETTRRPATILFCDIRNFTPYAESTDPDRLIAQLNLYFTRMLEAISAESGSLDKFLGDGLMAFFGPLLETENSEAAAVRAAQQMQRGMAEINRQWAEDGWGQMQIGIGINAGEVVAGNLGSVDRLEYTVIGDVVNVASRLSGAATPGQILVTEGVARNLPAGEFEAKPLPPIPLKGKSEKISAFEIGY